MESRLLLVLVLLLTGTGRIVSPVEGQQYDPGEGDPRVRIVSPVEGQQFAPGDKVSVVVEIAPSLHATDGSVGVLSLGSVKGTGFTSTCFNAGFLICFNASFVIPDGYAGPLTLWPDVYAGGTVVGPKVTIKVRPLTPPKQLIPVNRNYYPSPTKKDPEQLYVKGLYANGLERDVSSSEAGTTYASSNPAVLTVDRDGRCRVVGTGLAVVTIENGGVRAFVMFAVDDPAHPNPPIDVTDQVAIRRDKLRVDQTKESFQRVTITNTTALPLGGPLFLAITGLPKGVIAYGGDGSGRHALDLPDGLNLFPGQSVTVELSFVNQSKAPLEYIVKVYHGRVL